MSKISDLSKKLKINSDKLKSLNVLLENATHEAAIAKYSKDVLNTQDRVDEIRHEIYNSKLNRLKSNIKSKSGMDFDDWVDMVKKLYVIDDDFTVTSRAINWKEEKSWSCKNELEVFERIAKLIEYKANDRKRGFGSHEQDVQRVKELV